MNYYIKLVVGILLIANIVLLTVALVDYNQFEHSTISFQISSPSGIVSARNENGDGQTWQVKELNIIGHGQECSIVPISSYWTEPVFGDTGNKKAYFSIMGQYDPTK